MLGLVLLIWGQPAMTQPGLGQEAQSNPIISQGDLEALMEQSDSSMPVDGGEQRQTLGGVSFLKLLFQGGALMIPIAIMSLLVVAIVLDRWLATRRNRLFPNRLRREVRRVGDERAVVAPAELYRTAELFPSAAARVLKELLCKVGRPIPEAEAAIQESVQREADRLYGNVRWLTLAAAVTPLLGLLGTVWGMIIAFYNTTQLSSGTNRAEFLAEGIYIALITTLAGLAVAIPAAIAAHYFEGKIVKNLSLVDVELRRLVPLLECYEGRTRFDIGSNGLTERIVVSDRVGTGQVSDHPTPIKPPKLRT
jgi:biopolymer transport protein ExbB